MNGMNMIQQLRLTCYMIAFGIVIMFSFTLINEICRQAKWNRYKRIAADFILVLFCGIIFYLLLIYKNYGLLRNYIFAGLVLGFTVHRICLQNLCKHICKHTARWVLWWSKKIKWILLAPWHLINQYFIQRIKRKMLAIHQRYARNAQIEDELEEII